MKELKKKRKEIRDAPINFFKITLMLHIGPDFENQKLDDALFENE